ncbi:MAG: hypothetical protein IKI54_04440 [Lachnospiraceae bacterium]|nr:hypothetical protein [Lachnospiraceae bacterium]
MKKRIFAILLIFSLLAGCSRKPEAPSAAEDRETTAYASAIHTESASESEPESGTEGRTEDGTEDRTEDGTEDSAASIAGHDETTGNEALSEREAGSEEEGSEAGSEKEAGSEELNEASSMADTSESAPVTTDPAAQPTPAPATSAPTTAQPTAPSVQPTVPQPTEHTHHFVQTEAKAYTCTENGYTIEVCTDCGAKKTTTYYAPGHTPGYWTTDVEPTASTEGHAYQTCYVCGAVIAEKTIPVLTYTYHAYSQAVLDLVNAERAKEGLSPLALDPAAGSAAQVRARETVDLFEHVRPNGTQCFTALDEAGATYRMAGENIACGQPTPEAVVDAWMHSEGHRANIMKPEFTHMGLGCCELSNDPQHYYIYWAQLFITK